MLTLCILFSISGGVLSLLALPPMAGKIKPNPFYGFRVKKTLDDPKAWYLVNAYYARRQCAVGLIVLVAALGLYFWPGLSLDGYALVCLAVFVSAFGVVLVQCARFLKRL